MCISDFLLFTAIAFVLIAICAVLALPVIFPLGLAKFVVNPYATGSPVNKTIGMFVVSALIRLVIGTERGKMTSGRLATISRARVSYRSG